MQPFIYHFSESSYPFYCQLVMHNYLALHHYFLFDTITCHFSIDQLYKHLRGFFRLFIRKLLYGCQRRLIQVACHREVCIAYKENIFINF